MVAPASMVSHQDYGPIPPPRGMGESNKRELRHPEYRHHPSTVAHSSYLVFRLNVVLTGIARHTTMLRAIPGAQHLPSQPATVFESAADSGDDSLLGAMTAGRIILRIDSMQPRGMSHGQLDGTRRRGPIATDRSRAAAGATGTRLRRTTLGPITNIRGRMRGRPQRLGDHRRAHVPMPLQCGICYGAPRLTHSARCGPSDWRH